MDEERNREIEQYLADTIIGRPHGFTVGRKHFALYPVTLGKMYLLQGHIEALEINTENLQKDVSLEALRLAREKTDECLTIICYHTCKTQDEIFNYTTVNRRKCLFRKELDEKDIATLMIIVLTADRTNLFTHYLGIDKEQDNLSAVMRIKARNDKSNITFGGKSVFGSLIDVACERYGWTKEYVVWGIDYTSLRLMLADKINSVYCTEDEMRNIPAQIRNQNDETIKPTKENMAAIMSMDWR